MRRGLVETALAVVLTVSLVAGLATSVSASSIASSKNSSGSKRVANTSDYSNQDLTERGKNRRLQTKRTGSGSVAGVAQLRNRVKQYQATKRVRVVTAYSSDGTVAGFDGVRVRTVKASELESVISQAEADKEATAVELDRSAPGLAR